MSSNFEIQASETNTQAINDQINSQSIDQQTSATQEDSMSSAGAAMLMIGEVLHGSGNTPMAEQQQQEQQQQQYSDPMPSVDFHK